jgi:hypothetical protein
VIRPSTLTRNALLLALPLAAGAGAAPAPGAPPPPAAAHAGKMLPDSTWLESWQLSNGLKVVTHDIPGCRAVAVTVAYPTGSDDDPPATPGLARLMAEVEMMAPAGDAPERTRAEMESLRPLGWSLKVNPRAIQLSEVATREQFPGVLHQVAGRMRGVSVTPEALKSGLASVRRDIGEHLLGSPDDALYYQARAYAGGASEKDVIDLAGARALAGIEAKALGERMRATFVPAGAVLALAGGLAGFNVHALVENQFAGIPAGTPPGRAADPAGGGFHPSVHAVARGDIQRPIGVIGVRAPALSDSLHPRFFLAMLLVGEFCHQSWAPVPPVSSRFRYSILDEPDLVRFYPTTAPETTDAGALGRELRLTLGALLAMTVVPDEFQGYRFSVLWLLGGPMPKRVLAQVRGDGAALNTLCNNLAARELSGGEAFWSRYRTRFLQQVEPGLSEWARWVCLPEHQVALLFTPQRK